MAGLFPEERLAKTWTSISEVRVWVGLDADIWAAAEAKEEAAEKPEAEAPEAHQAEQEAVA